MKGMLTVLSAQQPNVFTTLQTVKADLNITDSSQDAYLATLINRANAAITRGLKGRSIGKGTFQDVFQPDDFPRNDRQERLTNLMLSIAPCTALTSITDRTGVALDPSLYYCDMNAAIIRQVHPVTQPAGTIRTPYGFWRFPVTVIYSGGIDLVGALPGDLDSLASQLVQAAYLSKGRSADIQIDSTQDVGETRYFDHSAAPAGAMVISADMQAILDTYAGGPRL